MKRLDYITLFLLISSLFAGSLQAQQDSTGLPGDDFSLEGALQMFHDAASPEDFEKAINTEGNHVNNLDLDGDGDIDYIRVIDIVEKEAHVFILQVPVSDKESQDIAVIELEKNGPASAILQIVGDADIYGEEVIVEPNGESNDHGTDSRKGKGPYASEIFVNGPAVVNVWFYPCVKYVYAPNYRAWVSPWHWRHYPAWWKPWKPVRWHVWHPYHRTYHRSFVRVHTHRTVAARHVYTPKRKTSAIVHTRHSASVGRYRVNHSKTKVIGPKGSKGTINKTKVTGPKGSQGSIKKTTIKGPKGKVRGTKTTVRKKKG